MSTISASTTSTTGFKITSDTTGTLVFQTGASPTTALTIGSDQTVSFSLGSVSVNQYGLGVGAAAPSGCPIYIYGSSAQAYIESSGASDAGITTKTTSGRFKFGTGIGASTNKWNIYDLVAGSSRFEIDGSGNLSITTAGANINTTPTSLPGSTSIGYSIISTLGEITFTENATPITYSNISLPPGTWQITFVCQVVDSSGTFNATGMACAITTDSSYAFPSSTNAGFRPDHNVMYTAGASLAAASYRGRVMHTRTVTNTTGSNVTYYFRVSTSGTGTGIYGLNGAVNAIKVY